MKLRTLPMQGPSRGLPDTGFIRLRFAFLIFVRPPEASISPSMSFTMRDMSRIVKDIDGEMLASGGLTKIKKANLKRMKPVSGKPRLGPCIGNVRNFIAIGLNYSDHAAEPGRPIPKEPIIFNKAPSCICGPKDDTIGPRE